MATPVVPSNTARVQLIDEFGVVYKATGGGSSVEIQVEGVDNASQTLVNFVSGTPANCTISNPSGGIVQFDITAAGTGDVVGPASAVANDIAVFSGTTGKLIADGGTTIAAINSSIAGKLSAVTADSPLSDSGTSGSHLVIADAAADGTTKGAATFNANDFNATSGVVSLDYTNGQKASASVPGYLSSTDWSTFNGKQASGNYITALTGDVTASGPGSVAATLANIPNATPMAGDLLATAIVAPTTPAAGKGAVYVDSTSKNLAVKDDAGVVKHGVQTQTSAASTFLTAISDAGAVSTGTAVTSINKTGSTALVGAVTLTGGSNVTLTQSGQDISIASTGGGGTTVFQQPGLRLTLTSGVPVTTSDVTAAGTLYWTPDVSGNVWYWDGAAWQVETITEQSLALTLTSGKNYDVFYLHGTGLVLSSAWTNDTTRADALGTQNGVTVLASDHTKLWIGTIRASGTNITEDSDTKRFVSNAYNAVPRRLRYAAADSHVLNNSSWQEWNGGTAERLQFVMSAADQSIRGTAKVRVGSATTQNSVVRIGLDGIGAAFDTTLAFVQWQTATVAANTNGIISEDTFIPSAGFHFMAVGEQQFDAVNVTYDNITVIATISN